MKQELTTEPFPDVIDFQEGPGILAKDFHEDGVPLIRLSGLTDGNSILADCNYLDPQMVALKWEHFRLKKGDVLLSSSASLGRIAVVDDIAAGSIAYTGIIRMRPKNERLYAPFIRYLLESNSIQSQLEMMGVGSVIRHFGPMHLRQMVVTFPLLPEQRRIAHILGTLDDKIENNRKTAKTLEAMAQAIFQSWFVDFDPVRAKMAGESKESICKRLKLTPEILDLFPDRLVDSELGEIPEGWEVGVIGDLFGFQNGFAFKSKDWQDYGIPVIKIGSVKPGLVDISNVSYVSEAVANQASDFRLQAADLVVGMTGYVGEVGLIPKTPTYPLLNQRVGRIVLNGRGTKYVAFAYCLTRQPSFKIAVEAKAHGTAQANVSSNAILSIPTVVPKSDSRAMFDKICGIIFEEILGAYENLTSISNLRDTLLPKLISGEVYVPEFRKSTDAFMNSKT